MDVTAAQEILRMLGFQARLVAHGIESLVFDIGGNRIAKVWLAREPQQIEPLRSFYAQLKDAQLPYATPVIDEILMNE